MDQTLDLLAEDLGIELDRRLGILQALDVDLVAVVLVHGDREVFLVLDVQAVHEQGDQVGAALHVDVAEQRVDDADVARGEHVEILRGAEVEREGLVLRLELPPHDAVFREEKRLKNRLLRLPHRTEFQGVGKPDGPDRNERDRGEILLHVVFAVKPGLHARAARLVEILHVDQTPGRNDIIGSRLFILLFGGRI